VTSSGQTLALAALILVGAVLRLVGLGDDGLLELPEPFRRLTDDNSALLHYLLVRVSVLLLGASEWSVRLPSALCGIVSIRLMFDLSRVCFNARAGLASTFLRTILPYHVHDSREGRAYALVILLLLGVLRCVAAWGLRPSHVFTPGSGQP